MTATMLGPFVLLAVVGAGVVMAAISTVTGNDDGERLRQLERQVHLNVDQSRQRMLQSAMLASRRIGAETAGRGEVEATARQVLANAAVVVGATRAWMVGGHGDSRLVVGREDGSGIDAPRLALVNGVAPGAAAATLMVSEGRASLLAVARANPGAPIVGVEVALDDAYAQRLADRFGAEVVLALRQPTGASTVGRSTSVNAAGALPVLASRFAPQQRLAGEVGGRAVLGTTIERNGNARIVAAMLPEKPAIADLGPRLASGLGLATLLAVTLAGVLAFRTGSSIARTASRVGVACRALMEGRFDGPVTTRRRDEIGRMASTFNTMAEAVVQREQRIRETAYRDPVTGLPTRILFEERVARQIATWRNTETRAAALVVIVDGLAEFNDTLGREASEAIAAELAERLRKVVRSHSFAAADPGGQGAQVGAAVSAPDVARIGASEFAFVVGHCDHDRARKLALRLVDMVGKRFRYDGQTLHLGGRVGIALFPDHGLVLDELLHAADLAGRAAAQEVTRIALYDPSHEREREAQLAMLGELRKALDGREVSLVFQPKVPLRAEARALAAEVLLRWEHPERGPQNPAEFVKFAERTGFISKLTMFAIDGALRHVAEWAKEGVSLEVSVNLTARDLADSDLPTFIVERLRSYQLPGSCLTVEVPESALVTEDPVTMRNVVLIDRIGTKLAVDNFGTAFAAIDRLKRLPIDYLKIDRRHVASMVGEASSRVVVKAAIDIAHALGLRAVAEGVEGPRELALLRRMGCDEAQGFYLGKPLTRQDFAAWVRHQASRFGVRPRTLPATSSGDPARGVVPARAAVSALGGSPADVPAPGEAA